MKRISSRIGLRSVSLAALLLAAAGCGGNRVVGKVTLNGVPVKSGLVTFYGEGQLQKVANINVDGEFQLDEPPPGISRVTVQNLSTYVPMDRRVMLPRQSKVSLPMPAAPTEALPRKYADPYNGLQFTATGGKQRFDIELTP
jgi:hypothetical protein